MAAIELKYLVGGAGWAPHVTIQNKVPAGVARALHHEMQSRFAERAGCVPGLLVWEYLGGPWKLMQRLRFELPSIFDDIADPASGDPSP